MAYTGKVFPFKHNWASSVIESLEWLTNVLPKRSGLEQRICLRAQPRRTLEYNVLTGGQADLDMRRRFDAFLWANQDQDIVVPIWADAEIAGVGNTLTTTHLATSLAGKDYDANGYIIVWRSYKDYEVVKVASLATSPERVLFTENLTGALTGIVAPARLCKFNPETNGVSYSTDLNNAVVQFEMVVPSAVVAAANSKRYAIPSVLQYRSSDIWNKSGHDGNVERDFIRKLDRIDFQTGTVRYDSIQTSPTLTHGHNRLIASRAEIAELLGWLYARQGRLKPFWIPSYEKDFGVLTSTSGTLNPAPWTNLVNVTEDAAKELTKVSGGFNFNAGASTVDALIGDGAIEFAAPGNTSWQIIAGLNGQDVGQGYAEIEFSLYMTSGNAFVWENGVDAGAPQQSYVAGTTVFKIERTGSTIKYYKNSTLFWTSAVPYSNPLYGDCSIADVGAEFGPVTLIRTPGFTASSFGYTANYLNKDGRRDIAVIRSGQAPELRRITAATDNGSVEAFTLDGLTSTIAATDRVSFARFCRLDHDRIELAWQANGTAQVQLKLRELFKTT